MGKQFRSCDLNQAYLLPPSLQDWLPEGHLARFVAEVVETYQALVHSGAPIAQINAVRKHLSALKGGRLARSAAPAHQMSVLVYDVTVKFCDRFIDRNTSFAAHDLARLFLPFILPKWRDSGG